MAKSRLLHPLQWYQWNPTQWQGSRKVQRMSWAARGLYRELMDECWLKGSVPSTAEGIADMFEVDPEEITPLLSQIIRCFDIQDDGSMTSPFIEEIRTETDARRIIQAQRRLGKDKHGNPRLTADSKSEPRITEPNRSEVVEKSREEKRKERTTSAPSPADSTPVAIMLPCTGKGDKSFPVTEGRIKAWSKDFPGVDILQALRNMRAWLEANPSKAKTASGIPRFIVNWLSKEQNNPRPALRPVQPARRTSAADEAFLAQLPASGGDTW